MQRGRVKLLLALIVPLIMALVPMRAWAVFTQRVPVQMFLSDGGGAVDGPVAITFENFDASVGGTSQWGPTLQNLTADSGLSFEFGARNP